MKFWEMVALAKAGKGGGSVPPEQISEAVDDWLEDNVDPETGYVLDSSLTMSNAAAPADKVGDLKSALKSGKEEDAIYHLGFYLDEDGDLCQVEEDTNNG